jgi:hypothetical protein
MEAARGFSIFDLGRGRISQKERKGTKEEFVVARLGAGRRNGSLYIRNVSVKICREGGSGVGPNYNNPG